ncbi:hypothetical protein [Labrys monachus]|uniref:Uncharacterized protein n=1 Tax=Labrys monachus TaxID=217067 RepID=A0ABU0FDU4_9HYPH|nr:hypothetical protein [Labrys monachus]MDQ0392596.1 hypothetical protein [Labrys monachus]
MTFCDWDWRPAVLFNTSSAFAMLKPNGPWVSVDALDVWATAGVMSEEDWRSKFEEEFGPLDLSKIPGPIPSNSSRACPSRPAHPHIR